MSERAAFHTLGLTDDDIALIARWVAGEGGPHWVEALSSAARIAVAVVPDNRRCPRCGDKIRGYCGTPEWCTDPWHDPDNRSTQP